MKKTRIERDFIGELEISNEKYYGIQTHRAAENFAITGIELQHEPLMIRALAMVKKAAALTNRDCGLLQPLTAEAIVYACDQIIGGKYRDQFVVDLIQGGAGTSVNMNMNEVISNIALEYLGREKGNYEYVHPNNHVNCSQSTNDVYPTAFRLALSFKITDFAQELKRLIQAFSAKGEEFQAILKMGRTQMQDAVPMTLGEEFAAFSTSLEEELSRLIECEKLCHQVNIGGTAIGTRVNTPEGYSEMSLAYLAEESGMELRLAKDLIAATSDTGDFVQIMGTVKRTAVKLSKICNDLRLLSSGPRAGLHEINLPAVQPGSSIMPGKINPVIPEMVNQTCFYVIGQDTAVTMASEAGQLQLNVMEPVMVFSIFTSLRYLKNAIISLNDRCVTGITANASNCIDFVMNSVGIVTFLNPLLGYEKCAQIAREALHYNKSIHKIVVEEQQLITQEKWDEIYSIQNLKHPRLFV